MFMPMMAASESGIKGSAAAVADETMTHIKADLKWYPPDTARSKANANKLIMVSASRPDRAPRTTAEPIVKTVFKSK